MTEPRARNRLRGAKIAALAVLSTVAATIAVAVTVNRGEPDEPPPPAAAGAARERLPYAVLEAAFDGSLGKGWKDWGWGARELADAGPARVRFSEFGGFVLRRERPGRRAGAVVFRYRARAEPSEFLDLSLGSESAKPNTFPRVRVAERYVAELDDGWREVLVPFQELNPTDASFDRIVLQAARVLGSDFWVEIDKVVLTEPGPKSGWSGTLPPRPARLKVRCDRPAHAISPLIYGISHGVIKTGESAVRIGGNPMTRHNWELGAWNTGSDWFFENVGDEKIRLSDWIDEAHENKLSVALVVPLIGWVAKDRTSSGFPKASFGEQRAHDPHRPEAGDGFKKDGTKLAPGAPTQTSVAAPPELIEQWIRKLREQDAARGARGVHQYILDNEPNLWHVTHRDVHPQPLSYDELLDRTLRYASAIRRADPEATIAGPAPWGWTEYFYSAKDVEQGGVGLRLDRRAHGDVPLIPWYLKQLAEHEKRTGTRLLDVLDVHFYPQAEGVYGGHKTDSESAARRLRSTRALWDPDYKDESWINEPVELLPRLKRWVAQNYPGRGISIGEWSFGALDHMSGGLAAAEALGRFAEHGVTSAFHWARIEEKTPAFQAFRAFRNFDGRGGRFLDWSVSTE
ncbi:MAG TPA: glycoside hydrolase family 44 protein, partial [Polyangiaceae bacterium]